MENLENPVKAMEWSGQKRKNCEQRAALFFYAYPQVQWFPANTLTDLGWVDRLPNPFSIGFIFWFRWIGLESKLHYHLYASHIITHLCFFLDFFSYHKVRFKQMFKAHLLLCHSFKSFQCRFGASLTILFLALSGNVVQNSRAHHHLPFELMAIV